MLTDARTGAERIRAIVGALGSFAPAGRGEELPPIEVQPVIEAAVVKAAAEMRRTVPVETHHGRIPKVAVDGEELARAVACLAVNAAEALETSAPQGGGGVQIVTSTDPAGRAIIEVRDTGCGIPDEHLPRIFEPFFTTKQDYGSTGVGLSVCSNIVRRMGGEIAIRSRVGFGTTVRVSLPPAAHDHQVEELPTEVEASARAVVLVVDDEHAVGQSLKRVLRAHDVTVVTTAAEALALVAAGRSFDLIISDLMMPQMSGMDFYDALSEAAPRLAERVVFVSGGAHTPGAAAFLARVPNVRLHKPYDVAEMRALVDRAAAAARRSSAP